MCRKHNSASKGTVSEVKFVLRVLNPRAFRALCQYEGEEIESGVSAEAFALARGLLPSAEPERVPVPVGECPF